MSITINGNGTITGLAVGGLPDGCVDTDTIATSVTSGTILQVVSTHKSDIFSNPMSGYLWTSKPFFKIFWSFCTKRI